MVISVESGKGRFSGSMCVCGGGIYYVQNSGLCLEFPLESKGKQKKREGKRYVKNQDKATNIYSTLKGKESERGEDLYLHCEMN